MANYLVMVTLRCHEFQNHGLIELAKLVSPDFLKNRNKNVTMCILFLKKKYFYSPHDALSAGANGIEGLAALEDCESCVADFDGVQPGIKIVQEVKLYLKIE